MMSTMKVIFDQSMSKDLENTQNFGLNLPWQLEVFRLLNEPLRLKEILRKDELLIPQKVQDIAKQNSISIDEIFALKCNQRRI
jgi:hypothetical protein